MELLYENGLVHDVADLYDLKAGQLAELPRLGEKSADNIIRSIRGSVEVPFRRVLFGLGIRFVGETTANTSREHFRSLDAVMRATREEFDPGRRGGRAHRRRDHRVFRRRAEPRHHPPPRAALKFEEEAREPGVAGVVAGRACGVSGKFRSRDETREPDRNARGQEPSRPYRPTSITSWRATTWARRSQGKPRSWA